MLLVLLYLYGKRRFGSLEKLGIPVIPPYSFFGSYPRPWAVHGHEENMKNLRKYGHVYGWYEGSKPFVSVSDPEMIKKIFITDFEHFTDRPQLLVSPLSSELMDFLKGNQWKTVRSAVTPPLSTRSKLKSLMEVLRDVTIHSCKGLDAQLAEKPQVGVELIEFCSALILQVTAIFSFGFEISEATDPKNPFYHFSKAYGTINSNDSPYSSLFLLPSVANFAEIYLMDRAMRFLVDTMARVVKERRASGVPRNDLVDSLIETLDLVPTKEFRDMHITEEIILVQGCELLLAGYDTSTQTISVAMANLVQNPDVLARLAAEVKDAELTYDSLQHGLPLLDAVARETLRVNSVVTRLFRLCVRDWEYGGRTFPRGTYFEIPTWPFHFDPEVFEEPERFLPDRWLDEANKERYKYHWLPFGQGPRGCPGYRMGLFQVKFVLAYLLQRYKCSATEATKIEYVKSCSFIPAVKPIHVRMEKLK